MSKEEIMMKSDRNLSDEEILLAISNIVEQKKDLDIYSTIPIYSVKELADKLETSVHTIRFYDKEHLFPFVKRDDANERLFSQSDLAYGKMILCLRRLGLSIHDCRLFILDTMEGDETVDNRLKTLLYLQNEFDKKIAELNILYNDLQYKIRFYSYLDNIVRTEKKDGTFKNKNRGSLSELHNFILQQKSLEDSLCIIKKKI